MKIVVIGGTGLIGSKLAKLLRDGGHDVIAASPNSGVNTITGEGVAEALTGAQVVVDVANSPSFDDAAVLEFFEKSGRNLLAAEKVAGVKHHVALSVVGTDRLQESGYFRAKAAQETLIRSSGTPYTIVHSTQFFEFLPGIVKAGTDGENIRLSPAFVQPISSDDVAQAMFGVVLGTPVNGIVEIAGPDRIRLSDAVRNYLDAKQDLRQVVTDASARYFGAELNDQTLIPGDGAQLGAARLADWLKSETPEK